MENYTFRWGESSIFGLVLCWLCYFRLLFRLFFIFFGWVVVDGSSVRRLVCVVVMVCGGQKYVVELRSGKAG